MLQHSTHLWVSASANAHNVEPNESVEGRVALGVGADLLCHLVGGRGAVAVGVAVRVAGAVGVGVVGASAWWWWRLSGPLLLLAVTLCGVVW